MVSHVYSKSSIHSSSALSAQSDAIVNLRLLPLLEASSDNSKEAVPHGIDVHSLFAGAVLDLITSYCFGLQDGLVNFTLRPSYRNHWLELYKARKGYGFFEQELPRLSRAARFLGVSLTPKWVVAATRELEAVNKKFSDRAIKFLKDNPGASGAQGTADDPVVVRAILAGMDKEAKSSGEASPIYSTALLQRELSVASETFDHVLAGQETTGVTLTYLSWHLSRSPELQSELRRELLTMLSPNMQQRNDGSSSKVATLPDSKQLDSLPILHAVIIETIRRYAPAGGPEPRVTPFPSCKIGPYELPGGVRISASVYNLHRDGKYFPDPEAWNHTRWLPSGANGNNDAEQESQRKRQFWGFSSGGRMCLGSNFAMHEMKLLIAAIYSNYSSHVVNDDGIEPTDGYTAHPKSGQLWLRFEKIE